jgi:NFU1 iron-sulfur cluster scaffold homolog, mitochondrial
MSGLEQRARQVAVNECGALDPEATTSAQTNATTHATTSATTSATTYALTYALHVERTGDPDVLRWVGHHPAMLNVAPGLRVPTTSDSTPLAQLMRRGAIAEIFANRTDLLIRKGVNEPWSTLAAVVREAILEEFAAFPLWLRIPAIDSALCAAVEPDLVLVQAVVTEAAGAVAQSHGGSIEVVSIAPTAITVQMHGACSGCSGTDATLSGLVLSAVRNRWPQFDAVLVVEPTKVSLLSSRWSKVNFSKR